ncbi:unnamed protein product [Nezara viridula]|uniref:Uncharacterized protein n=1 Tax=Nezara viridula TaxID=85310 RepID=A0A9P0HJ28_NEZVI|nr:unnamed protein product [Nezara viridula]
MASTTILRHSSLYSSFSPPSDSKCPQVLECPECTVLAEPWPPPQFSVIHPYPAAPLHLRTPNVLRSWSVLRSF